MKKTLVILLAVIFAAGMINTAFAKDPEKIEVYIAQLKVKLAEATKAKQNARIIKLKAMIAAEEKNLMVKEEKITPTPETQSSQSVQPSGNAVKATPTALFGFGIPVCGEVGTLTNRSIVGARFDVILPEPLGLAAWIGLPAQSLMYKVGFGYSAGQDNDGNEVKAVPLYADGVLMLPAELLGGINSYVGGGINYIIYRKGRESGTLGGQFFIGIMGDIGLAGIGKTYAQIGYSILRSGTALGINSISSRGLSLAVGQTIVL